MFELDEEFLERIGLGSLSDDIKKNLLEKYQNDLEIRIGEKMSKDLSDSQLKEFEKIIDDDKEIIKKWLDKLGDYKNDEVYKRILSSHGAETDVMLNDYVTAKWLNKNCPQYPEHIKAAIKEISDEIIRRKDVILWEYGGGA